MTHLVEVAGMIWQIEFVRFLLALIVMALVWDGYTERRAS